MFCFLFMQLKCLCWLVRTDVRHSRDCPICKCVNVYLYKIQFQERGHIAINRSPGNTSSDRFLCDVCMAPEGERCEIICSRRLNGGRCWPSIHAGIITVQIFLNFLPGFFYRVYNKKMCDYEGKKTFF